MDGNAAHVGLGPEAIYKSPNLLMKALALLLLYVFLGYPSEYETILERRNWYVIFLGVIVVPLLLVWSLEVLVWRVRLSSSTFEIRSLLGVLKKPTADIRQMERTGGRISVVFKDGSRLVIPAILFFVIFLAVGCRSAREDELWGHYRATNDWGESILENFLEGRGKRWEWDDYASVATFNDTFLQEVQARMAALSIEFPPTIKGHYCAEAGFDVIRHYVRELRAKATIREKDQEAP